MRVHSCLFLCLLFSVALATQGKRITPADGSGLTKPLIVDPNAPTEAESANLANIATIFASEPASASQAPPSAAEEDQLVGLLAATGGATTGGAAAAPAAGGTAAGGSDTSSQTDSSQESQSAIETEIKLLSSLVEHGKAIAAALPDKENRLKSLAAQLNAAKGAAASQGAQAKLAEQELLLAQIQLKITALQKKLEDLQTTETKLTASINQVKQATANTNAVAHVLNQEAAVASVGGGTTAAATTGSASPAAVQAAPTSFLDDI